MRTKLVYILTCKPEDKYIEQAMIAIWSARYWNPNAHIVLLTDDKTSELLHRERGGILQYVTEEIVTSFDKNKQMHYRSRWLKTKVRELVTGELLYIDCDTICQKPLNDIDNCVDEIAMVPDEHMRVKDYPQCLKDYLSDTAFKLNYDILKEEWYYNGGVIYAKDTENVHLFFNEWHMCWLEGEKLGIGIDQAGLGKANLLCGHIIKHLDNVWNVLIYMSPIFAKEGKILHFWNFRNKSFIFCEPFLNYIRNNGLTEYAKDCILNPMRSVLPFDNELANNTLCYYLRERKRIKSELKKYKNNVDSTLKNHPWDRGFSLMRKYIKIKVLKLVKIEDVYFS